MSLQQHFDDKLESPTHSQQQTHGTPYTVREVVRVSIKGSCAIADPSVNHIHLDLPKQCEL